MSAGGGYVALALYVRAAFEEATGDQRRLLRTKLPPMLRRMRELQNDDHNWPLAVKSLLLRVHQVMGPEWLPKEDSLKQIKLLLGRPLDALQIGTPAAMDVGEQAEDGAAVVAARKAEREAQEEG